MNMLVLLAGNAAAGDVVRAWSDNVVRSFDVRLRCDCGQGLLLASDVW